MATALGACSEIERAGGHAADTVAVQLLRWYLTGDICTALKAAFSTGGAFSTRGSISEKGLLQLLFDLRFLTTMLEAVPPPPLGAEPASAGGGAAARMREVASTESELARHIDPIDWATYEAHLYSRVGQFSQRSKALLGLASRGAPAPKLVNGVAPPMQPITQPAESNILRMASSGTRFSYLPVNTPAALRQQQQQQQQRQQVATPAPASALLDDGPETQYSFALLTTGRSRPFSAAAGSSGRDSGAAGGAGAAAGVGAAALEALRQSSFGSLLGDKAAEMTASFGDWSSLTNLPSFKR